MRNTRLLLVLACTALVGSLLLHSVSSYRTLSAAASRIVEGEVTALHRSLRMELQVLGEAPRSEDLEEVLASGDFPGLESLALLGPEGNLRARAGEALAAEQISGHQPGRGQGLEIRVEGEGAVAWTRWGPRRSRFNRRRRRFLEAGRNGGRGRRWQRIREEPPDPPGVLVMAYRSVLAREMAASGVTSLWVGGLTAGFLVATAFFLLRLLGEREALAAARARQERLASLGEMSAVLAHEIRNPLTSLKGHAQLLEELAPPEGRLGKKAGRIATEVVRLEALVNDLLDFVRAGSVDPCEAAPVGLLREAVDMVPGKERVELSVGEAPGKWKLDPVRVRQVLVNLVQNACQADPEEGPVRVLLAERDGELIVEVRDQGPGVPPEDREKVFEPFVTGRTKGTGLGLAVARRLVELHGGSLVAEEAPEGGALFRARFPPEPPRKEDA